MSIVKIGTSFIYNEKTYTVLAGPDDQGDYRVGWMEDGKRCESSFWRHKDIIDRMFPKVKVIKLFQNNRLYDTEDKLYVDYKDIFKIVRNYREILIIDNKSKKDITEKILTQIILDRTIPIINACPLSMLYDIIREGDGTLYGYIKGLRNY